MADLQDNHNPIRYCDNCGGYYPIGHRHWDYVGLSPFGCPIFENDSPPLFQPTEPGPDAHEIIEDNNLEEKQ